MITGRNFIVTYCRLASRIGVGVAIVLYGAAIARADGPSVDDLLNIKPTPARPADAQPQNPAPAQEPAKPAPKSVVPLDPSVQRKLSGQDAGDLFVQAVRDMAEAGDRLGKKSDLGTDTQRLQIEAIQKLDGVIAASRQQQQSSSSSSSSSSSDSQSQSQSNPGSRSDQGSQQNQSQGDKKQGDQSGNKEPGDSSKQGQQNGGRNPSDGAGKPPRPPGNPNDPLEQTRKEWGNLPSRTRDELIQAQNEPFSPVYRELTEQYYRRLAEEKK